MIESNPGIGGAGPYTACDRRKQRGASLRNFIDLIALCDKNVARCEGCRRGTRGLSWSDSHVFFRARTNGARRNRRQHGDIPHAVDRIDVLGAVFGHDQISLGSGHAYGAVLSGVKDNGDINKQSWIGV